MNIQIYNTPLTVRHRAMDLGCDVSYGSARVKAKSKIRLAKAVRTLHRTKRHILPQSFKKLMTVTLTQLPN